MAIVHSCQKMCVWGRKFICVHLFTFFREKRPQRPIPRPPLKPRQNCWPPQPPYPLQPPNSPPQLNTPPRLRQLLQLRVLAEQELQALPRRKKPPQPTMTSSFGSRPNGGQSCRCLWCVGVARCEHTKHREAQCAHRHRWYRGLLYAHQACPPSASTITSSLTQWTEDYISFSVFCLQKGSPEVNQCMKSFWSKTWNILFGLLGQAADSRACTHNNVWLPATHVALKINLVQQWYRVLFFPFPSPTSKKETPNPGPILFLLIQGQYLLKDMVKLFFF